MNSRSIPGFTTGHISSVENGYVAPSEELVETYINLFDNARVLRALFNETKRASEAKRQRHRKISVQRIAVTPPQSMADVRVQEDVTRHYLVESHDADCLFGPTGAIVELRLRVAIRARTPGVRLYYAGSYYDAEKRRGILQAEPLTALKKLAQLETDVGAIKSFFELEHALSPEDRDPYVASYKVRVTSRQRALPQLAYYSQPGTIRIGIRATFDPMMRPEHLWTFSVPNLANLEHRPQDKLPLGPDGSYAQEFWHLVPGWCYGFSWVWDT